MYPNYSECIRTSLIKVSNELDNFLSGYVSRKTDKYLPFVQIMDLPTLVGSIPLQTSEWRLVLKFIERVIHYVSLKTNMEDLERNDFLTHYYSKCISWLFASMSVSYAEKVERVGQLWRLVMESSLTFAKKLRLLENRTFKGDGQALAIKIGHLNEKQNVLRFRNPEGSLSVATSVTRKESGSSLVIAFSNKLDAMVNYSVESNRSITGMISWRSPIVTIHADKDVVDLKSRIIHRISRHSEMESSCGRLMEKPYYHWDINASACALEDRDGLVICICSEPGSYAILEVSNVLMAQYKSAKHGDDNLLVSLCCIESLTLSILTTFGLSWQLYYKRYNMRWKQLEVSTCISLLMIDLLVLLNRNTSIIPYTYWLSLALEFLVLETLVSQITIVLLLKIELKERFAVLVSKKGVQIILQGISLLLPTTYAVTVYYWFDMSLIHSGRAKEEPSKTSFHSAAYLISIIILSIIYILLSINVTSLTKKCNFLKAKSIELRLSLLKKSGILTVNLMLFVLSSIFFLENGDSKSILFAVPCGTLGVSLLLCYALGRDGQSKENRRSFFPMVSCHTPPLSSIPRKKRSKDLAAEEGGPLLSSIQNDDSRSSNRASWNSSSNDTFSRASLDSKLQEIPCRLRVVDNERCSCLIQAPHSPSSPSNNAYINHPLSLSQILKQADGDKYANISVSVHKLDRKQSISLSCKGRRISCSEYVEADLFNSYMSMKSFFPTNLHHSESKDLTLSPSASCITMNRSSGLTESNSSDSDNSFRINLGQLRKLSLADGTQFSGNALSGPRPVTRRRCSLPFDFNRCAIHKQNDFKRM